MSIISTPIKGGFIFNDGLKILVAKSQYSEPVKVKISETLAAAIYKVITNFNTALVMKQNYFSKPAKQTYVIDDESAALDDLVTAVLDLNKSARIENATLFVSSSVGSMEITTDTMLNLIGVLKDAGAEPDATYGKYSDIKFAIEPPAVNVMGDGIVYVLSVNYKDYAAGTCFMVSEEDGERVRNIFDPKTGELTPISYGDPEDASTYPECPEEDAPTAPATVGGNDVDTAELVANNIDAAVTLTASENINIVNNTMYDGNIKATIA